MRMDEAGSSALQKLMEMDDEVVSATDLAPVVRIHPSLMIGLVKTGKWSLCETVQMRGHVWFDRRDFLCRCGCLNDNKSFLGRMLSQLDEIRRAMDELREKEENRA